MKKSILASTNVVFFMFLSFFNCTNQDSGLITADTRDYATLRRQIKKMTFSGQELDKKLDDLREQFNINKNPKIVGVNLPNVVKPPLQIDPSVQVNQQALFKTQALSPLVSVCKECAITRPYFERFVINPNQWISVEVIEPQYPSVDAFAVLYTLTNGSYYDYKLEQRLSVLGYNDDSYGLLPYIYWRNYSSSSVEVVALVFAYDQYSGGAAKVRTTVSNRSPTQIVVPMTVTGTAFFHDDYQFIDGSGNILYSVPSGWSRYLDGSVGLTAVNEYFGGYTFGSYKPYSTGDSYMWAFNFSEMKGMANDDSPNSYGAEMTISKTNWMSFPSGSQSYYPNVIVIGGYSTYGNMRFIKVAGYQHY
jgi:hypothetical protein